MGVTFPKYILRHKKPYRTRIQFPSLRHDHGLCKAVQKELSSLDGTVRVVARPSSGSIIVSHPAADLSVASIVAAVHSARDAYLAGGKIGKGKRVEERSQEGPKALGKKNGYHLSGRSLIASGIYLAYLYFKRVTLFAAVTATSLISLPALVTLAISLPIQKQAIDNLRRTGKPDTGIISATLLYFSLLSGNILSTYTVFWLFNLSGWIESKIKRNTRQTIRQMLAGKKEKAWLVKDGCEIEVEAADLKPGDIIVLRLGNKVMVDGRIVSGTACINESALTGEPMPARKSHGQEVFSGTTVVEGEIQVEALKTGENTRLASIIRLIENVENDQGELQLTSNRFSQLLVPFSLSLAAITFLITGNVLQAMAMLIITCPCAIRLSTSVAISSAMAKAVEEGILVKGGRFIETAGKVDALVVDKTGTLTVTGTREVRIYHYDKRYKDTTLLCLAAGAQIIWPHPVGKAIVEKVAELELRTTLVEDATFTVGKGVRGRVGGQELVFGSRQFLEEQQISLGKQPIESEKESCTPQLFLAMDGRLLAGFSALQRIREKSVEAIARLRRLGVGQIVLLSGDQKQGTLELGEQLGVDHARWQQSPEDKAYWISKMRKSDSGQVIAMVGDGINDTPAFAASDLSISIGDTGADITVEYSDVVLQSGGLDRVADLFEIGRKTDQTLKQSYFLAISLNLFTLMATGLGLFTPVAGALVHNCITVAAVGNAATLRSFKPGQLQHNGKENGDSSSLS